MMTINYIHTPNQAAIENRDQYRAAIDYLRRLMSSSPALGSSESDKLITTANMIESFEYWLCPTPELLNKVYDANPVLAYYSISRDYFVGNHHLLHTVASIEETAAAGTEAVRDYPYDYLPLLPAQLAIQHGIELLEEVGEL